MSRLKTALIIFFSVIACLSAFLAAVFACHRILLKKERGLLNPLGQIVEVDGHGMSVWSGGDGEDTLVFLSGSGTCSPVLDFKSLYSLLSGRYRIAVPERFGYGSSDVVDKPRDIDSILYDTRASLRAAGIGGPYVLVAHSMAGLEALYWAQKYPCEVKAVIGLDMAVPGYYEDMRISMPLMGAARIAACLGLTRLVPGISERDAVRHGTLSGQEKEIYRAFFFSRTMTVSMINEARHVRENAEKVRALGRPEIPVLLFVSDGSGGTGFSTETWRRIAADWLSGVEEGECVLLDCPHYVHDYEYAVISERIVSFISGMDGGSAHGRNCFISN